MDQVSQIRERIDIVALISEYITLKRAGRNFKSPCPFHTEKSPSFVVSPERQIWHCFGCNKGGDVFTFLMEYEHLEFAESLRMLAKRAGITLIQSARTTQTASQKETIYSLNRLAAEFYHYILTKHKAGEKARLYLETRRITPQVTKTFLLGFSPLGSTLTAYLMKKKAYKKEDIVDSGLGLVKNGKLYDFFSHRLMFPLFDHLDNIVGFSGRILDETSFGPKYVNTRETVVYHKGHMFFGLNSAKQEIKKTEQAIIVEGEFDVISCFMEGITNVVAVKGTALTEEQVQLLSRFAKRVSLCFDQDNAGQEATRRSVAAIEKKGLSGSIIDVPGGKDPDEALKQDASAFKKAVKHPIGIYDYFFEKTFEKYDQTTADGKKRISDELLTLFALIENEIVKEHYLRRLSQSLDISYESIMRQKEKLLQQKPAVTLQPEEKKKKDRVEVLEEYILALVLQAQNPMKGIKQVERLLDDVSFAGEAYKKILEQIFFYSKNHGQFESQEFLRTLPQELVSAFDTCFLFPLPVFSDEKVYEGEIIKMASQLKALYLRKCLKELSEQIKQKEEGEEDLVLLQQEFSTVLLQLNTLENVP